MSACRVILVRRGIGTLGNDQISDFPNYYLTCF